MGLKSKTVLTAALIAAVVFIALVVNFFWIGGKDDMPELKNVVVGMSREEFFTVYPKVEARTYRTLADGETISYTYQESPEKPVQTLTFYIENGKVKRWRLNDRAEVVEQYLSEYCSQSFIKYYPKIFTAIRNALTKLPDDVFLSVTERARPVLFTEYHYTGIGRFANSSEIFSFPEDAPSFEDGMTIIKMSTELENSGNVKAIEGIVLHELAHRYLEHAKKGTAVCQREREANRLVKSWGLAEEFKQASQEFGRKAQGQEASPCEDEG